MKFIIPKGGKTVSVDKRLISFPAGEVEVKCKDTQEKLSGAKGVTKPQGKKRES